MTAARTVLERAREDIRAGRDARPLVDAVLRELEGLRRPRLRRVLNATGVLVHTNLGQAPLAPEALARVVEVGGLLDARVRPRAWRTGSRQEHLALLLATLTGAEAALVVNNNAAAVLLALAALADGRDVVVSRGELIEIGDGFRSPTCSRARVHASSRWDDEQDPRGRLRAGDRAGDGVAAPRAPVQLPCRGLRGAAAPRRASPSCAPARAAARGRPRLGRARSDRRRAPPAESLRAGADLVCFSGDKLLGGPQAGIVVGRAGSWSGSGGIRCRALRADKLTLAALEGTLSLALAPETRDRIPVLRMLHEPLQRVRARAERLARLVGGRSRRAWPASAVALPARRAPERGCAVEEELAERLRLGDPPVVALVRDGRTLLDCRTLGDAEVDEVAAAVAAARA